MNDTNFLKENGRSYLVSAFLPAAIFVPSCYFLIGSVRPVELISHNHERALLQSVSWLMLTVVVVWLAFFLFSVNDAIVRCFERYKLPGWTFHELVDRKRARFRNCFPRSRNGKGLIYSCRHERMKESDTRSRDVQKFTFAHWIRSATLLCS